MPEPHDPSVAAVITVNDMYHEIQGLRADVRDLKSSVDTIPLQIANLSADVADHETRIRARESLRLVTWGQMGWIIMAIIAMIGAVAGVMQAMHG